MNDKTRVIVQVTNITHPDVTELQMSKEDSLPLSLNLMRMIKNTLNFYEKIKKFPALKTSFRYADEAFSETLDQNINTEELIEKIYEMTYEELVVLASQIFYINNIEAVIEEIKKTAKEIKKLNSFTGKNRNIKVIFEKSLKIIGNDIKTRKQNKNWAQQNQGLTTQDFSEEVISKFIKYYPLFEYTKFPFEKLDQIRFFVNETLEIERNKKVS